MEEFIDFLTQKIDTDYFDNKYIRNNYRWFCFSAEKSSHLSSYNSANGESYEEIFNKYESWHKISQRIIEKIYG